MSNTMQSNNVSAYIRRLKSGFTLIEILVVIAIISLLAAILFPVFAKARENARRASCMSNQKQLALAILQYAQDYDEHLPSYWNGRTGSEDTWPQQIYPYTKSTQVFYCPSNSSGLDTSQLPAISTSAYGLNAYLTITLAGYNSGPTGNRCRNDGGCYGISLAGISTSPPVILLADSPASKAYFVKWQSSLPATLHLEGTNFAFIDGHVKWFKSPGNIYTSLTYWYPTY